MDYLKVINFLSMIHHTIAKILVLIGALNWGLVGASNFLGRQINLVEYIFVENLNAPTIADTIYILVGLAAVIMIINMLTNRS